MTAVRAAAGSNKSREPNRVQLTMNKQKSSYQDVIQIGN